MTRKSELLAANAALEMEVAKLREALTSSLGFAHGLPVDKRISANKLLSTPFSPTTLHELIKAIEKLTIERCTNQFEDFDGPEEYRWDHARDMIADLPTGQIDIKDLITTFHQPATKP